jgi:mono/diheme cytochrome c family protein
LGEIIKGVHLNKENFVLEKDGVIYLNRIRKIQISARRERMGKILQVIVAGSFLLFLLGTAFAKDPTPPKKTPELLTKGKKLYEQNCSTCHGSKGDGKGQLGAALKPVPSDFAEPLKKWPKTKGDLQKIFDVISKGIPNSAMVKWDHLSVEERWALVYYVVNFATPTKTAPKKKVK